MESISRLIPCVCLEFVELSVLFILDFRFAAQPEGVDRVDLLVIQFDRKLDKARVPLDDLFDGFIFGEALVIIF